MCLVQPIPLDFKMPGIQTFPCTPIFLNVSSNSELKPCVGKFSTDKTNILRQIKMTDHRFARTNQVLYIRLKYAILTQFLLREILEKYK